MGREEQIINDKLDRNLVKIKSKVIKILKKYKIKKAGIFGSSVRRDFNEKSDIDIIIQPPKDMGLEFVKMSFELEKVLGRRVDIVTYKYLSPYLKKSILEEEIRIL